MTPLSRPAFKKIKVSFSPVFKVNKKSLLLCLWVCGREASKWVQAVVNALFSVIHQFVHTSRRALAGPKDSSTYPQAFLSCSK